MHGLAQPEDRFSSSGEMPSTAGDAAHRSGTSERLEGMELDAALQLLVERAQYITGATGTALALPQGSEMVCRASAGSCAPGVGARLQVQSGLTGESIVRRQLLRCDNAETDPRVNLEACRALGIASIVVLPLLRKNGEVRGLFELFSDHPYAFEERDLVALERMAELTMTALDLAEQRQSTAPVRPREVERVAEVPAAKIAEAPPAVFVEPPAEVPTHAPQVVSTPVQADLEPPASAEPLVAASVPEAMRRVQKCSACGFPVSEGRTLCLDCEKKDQGKEKGRKNLAPAAAATEAPPGEVSESAVTEAGAVEGEIIPAFLANSPPPNESWLANHVNLLAIIVLILGVLVAVVVFR